jgi:hypothetical protein
MTRLPDPEPSSAVEVMAFGQRSARAHELRLFLGVARGWTRGNPNPR